MFIVAVFTSAAGIDGYAVGSFAYGPLALISGVGACGVWILDFRISFPLWIQRPSNAFLYLLTSSTTHLTHPRGLPLLGTSP